MAHFKDDEDLHCNFKLKRKNEENQVYTLRKNEALFRE